MILEQVANFLSPIKNVEVENNLPQHFFVLILTSRYRIKK